MTNKSIEVIDKDMIENIIKHIEMLETNISVINADEMCNIIHPKEDGDKCHLLYETILLKLKECVDLSGQIVDIACDDSY
jgi:hypothetical protein